MPFTSPLIVQQLSSREWILVAPLSYQGSVDHFTVPEGEVTDFATVPNWLQSLVQSTGTWTLAAVIHDWMCRALAAGNCIVTSSQADGIFRRIMREEGVGPVRRWAMWAAVRWAALVNRHRRPGWLNWRDTPAVLAISAAVLAAVAVAAIGIHMLVDLALEALL